MRCSRNVGATPDVTLTIGCAPNMKSRKRGGSASSHEEAELDVRSLRHRRSQQCSFDTNEHINTFPPQSGKTLGIVATIACDSIESLRPLPIRRIPPQAQERKHLQSACPSP